jgi:hypothetical protein
MKSFLVRCLAMMQAVAPAAGVQGCFLRRKQRRSNPCENRRESKMGQ